MAKLKKLEPKPREAKYRLTLTREEARHIQTLAGRCASESSPLRDVWNALFKEFRWDHPTAVDSGDRTISAIHFREK